MTPEYKAQRGKGGGGVNSCPMMVVVIKICSYSIFANLKKQPTAKSQLQSLESDVGQNKNINFPKKIIY